MARRVLELKLTDAENRLQPDTLSAGRLAEIVRLYESALLAAAPDVVDGDASPAVAITGIDDGCVSIKKTIGMWCLSAAVALKSAIASGDYTNVPRDAQRRLAELSRYLIAANMQATFTGLSRGKAEISADHPVPDVKRTLIKSRTTIYGECVRVGGQKPKASIRLFSTDRQLDIDVSPELAQQLGQRLYDHVGVCGQGMLDVHDGEIVSFRGEELLPYMGKDADPVGALARVRDLAPTTWLGVDPEEYVRQARDED